MEGLYANLVVPVFSEIVLEGKLVVEDMLTLECLCCSAGLTGKVFVNGDAVVLPLELVVFLSGSDLH